MVDIIIYSKKVCSYCVRLKDFFDNKQIAYQEIMVDQDPVELEKMMTLSGRRTVPQLFIGEQHIGGYDDAMALHEQGKLLPLCDK